MMPSYRMIWLIFLLGPVTVLAGDQEELDLLKRASRVVFLGDSISFSGHYVACFDAWLLTRGMNDRPVVINVGLPSETVSGLSEEGHAGGRFPRPDLAERLERVLAITRPDLVFACYGINCGIYQPFDEQRFQRYQQGIAFLKQRVEAAGATLVMITPPFYDDQRAKNNFSYDAVLRRYSEWLVAQRQQGWLVVDLHAPMAQKVKEYRKADAEFTFQPDAVHPNASGHWFMASVLIRWFGDEGSANAASPQEMLTDRKISPDVLTTVTTRLNLRRNAYLSAAGHKRPGIKAGTTVEEAERQAKTLTENLRQQLNKAR